MLTIQYIVTIAQTDELCGFGHLGRTSFGFIFQNPPMVSGYEVMSDVHTATVTTTITEVLVCLHGVIYDDPISVRVTIGLGPLIGMDTVASGLLNNLTDVVITSPIDNSVLAYDSASGVWVDQTAAEAALATASHAHTLAGLSGVTITTPADNSVLAYDSASGAWIDQTAAEAALATASHAHTTASQTANTVYAGPTGGAAADPTFRALVAADIAADLVNDTHIDWGVGANQVSGVDVPLADAGNYFATDNVEAALQQAGAVIGASHAAVTLGADADVLLGLSTQQITLDSQTANTVFAGPATGAAAAPTFRALVAADIAADLINDTHIDWGVGTAQVSAVDVPLADAGAYFATDNVEAALQQIGAGGVPAPLRVVTDTTTELTTDANGIIICDKGTAMTVNLLPATGSKRKLTIPNVGAGVVTADGDTGDTITGETTQTINQHESITIVDYASGKWAII